MRLEAECGECVLFGRCALCDDEGADEGGDLTRVMQSHSCAVTSDGGVKCWGWNDHGQVMVDAALPPSVDLILVLDFSIIYLTHSRYSFSAAWR